MSNALGRPERRQRARSSVLAQGTSAIWLTGSALTIALVMIIGLIALVIYLGGRTFWPRPIVQVTALDGVTYLGEVIDEEEFRPTSADFARLAEQVEKTRGKEALAEVAAARLRVAKADGKSRRRKFYTGNRKQEELNRDAYLWVPDYAVTPGSEARPEWAVVCEREQWRNFYGVPTQFLLRTDGESSQVAATDPAEVWRLFEKHHPEVRRLFERRVSLTRHDLGALNRELNEANLNVRQAELKHGKESSQAGRARAAQATVVEKSAVRTSQIKEQIAELDRSMDRYRIVMRMSDGREVPLRLEDIVRAYPANQLSWGGKLRVYVSRWWEFLTGQPREANSEGGVWPAILGTVAMTLVMSLLVVPFGVMAALYLREYAKSGPIISTVRIAINNLAGVPSIVFGIFGLGFFCYVLGGGIDRLFYSANPNPTFGTGGLFWASLTLALLTLPVVIVATEEALSSVPNSMREGSYACGASKWQTIWRIVLPRAMPGIMTGMILAMARGAGEVAPLMLVGAVKEASNPPIDGSFPFVHPERSFLHLGFHIYDVGFQSTDSEAARPMVFTTTLLLIVLIALLNLTAIWLRSRLRRRFGVSQF